MILLKNSIWYACLMWVFGQTCVDYNSGIGMQKKKSM